MPAKVSLYKAADYDLKVLEDIVIKSFDDFGGISGIIKPGSRVLLKPNLLRAGRTPDDPLTTNPAFIYAVAKVVKDNGALPFVADSPAFGSVRGIFRKNGWLERFSKLGVPLHQFKKARKVRSSNDHYRHHAVDELVGEADTVINLPKIKVHCQLTMTLAIKNLYGCVSGKRKAWRHMAIGDKENRFGEMLVENYNHIKPAFTIIDGIVAMERHGPSGGDPVNLGLVAAGIDCVALERVLSEILNVPITDLPTLIAAEKLDIGEMDMDKIEICGTSIEDLPKYSLKMPVMQPISFAPHRLLLSILKNLIQTFKENKAS
jgi:uncharacterized protein (DUF362 family)